MRLTIALLLVLVAATAASTYESESSHETHAEQQDVKHDFKNLGKFVDDKLYDIKDLIHSIKDAIFSKSEKSRRSLVENVLARYGEFKQIAGELKEAVENIKTIVADHKTESWKDLGGKLDDILSELVDGVNDIAKAAMAGKKRRSLVHDVGEKLLNKLKEKIDQFKEFAKNVVNKFNGDNKRSLLGDASKASLSVFKKAVEKFMKLIQHFKERVLGGGSEGGNKRSLDDFTNSLKNMIEKVKDAAKEIKKGFHNVKDAATGDHGDGVEGFGAKIDAVLKELSEAAHNVGKAVTGHGKDKRQLVTNLLKKVAEQAKKFFSGIKEVFNTVSSNHKRGVVLGLVDKALQKVKDAYKKLTDFLKSVVSSDSGDDEKRDLSGLIEKVKNVKDKLGKAVGELHKSLHKVKDAATGDMGLKDKIDAVIKELKSAVHNIGKAVTGHGKDNKRGIILDGYNLARQKLKAALEKVSALFKSIKAKLSGDQKRGVVSDLASKALQKVKDAIEKFKKLAHSVLSSFSDDDEKRDLSDLLKKVKDNLANAVGELNKSLHKVKDAATSDMGEGAQGLGAKIDAIMDEVKKGFHNIRKAVTGHGKGDKRSLVGDGLKLVGQKLKSAFGRLRALLQNIKAKFSGDQKRGIVSDLASKAMEKAHNLLKKVVETFQGIKNVLLNNNRRAVDAQSFMDHKKENMADLAALDSLLS